MKRPRLSIAEYKNGILKGDRGMLGQAITLVESGLPGDRILASELLSECMPHAGGGLRIGLTGVPGVGKSTFIDAFGSIITAQGKKCAVLAVDPSSQVTRGSILGDKTRMERLSRDPLAFIRPSPSKGTLGGVTRNTREVMILCEAAGFEVILIETVGAGQSEIAVHSMVDFFLVLMLPGAGDELQGIKKGVIELADAIVINKADGDNVKAAKIASSQYATALHYIAGHTEGWKTHIATCSALEETGIKEIWEMIGEYDQLTKASGALTDKRRNQSLNWMRETIRFLLEDRFFSHQTISPTLKHFEQMVFEGVLPPTVAAEQLVAKYFSENKKH